MKRNIQKSLFIILTLVILFTTITAPHAVATSVSLPEPTDDFFVNDFAGVINSDYETSDTE
jgi:hypothetical protein